MSLSTLATPDRTRSLWRFVHGLWRGAARPTRCAWSLIILFGVLDLVFAPLCGFTAATGTFLLALSTMLPLAGMAAFYAHNDRNTCLSVIPSSFLLLVGCMFVVGPFCYIGMSWSLPAVDATLARIDRALGFDWVWYNDLLTNAAWLEAASGWLYFTSVPQIFLLVILLSSVGRIDRVREVVFLLVVSAFATATLSVLFPALGAHAFHGVADGGKAFYLDQLNAIRAGTLRHLDPPQMVGICTWPSYHTIISLALIRITRGLRYVGPLVLLWNLALLAAVPVWGSHFLSDMIGGALVLACVMAAWHWLERSSANVGLAPAAAPGATT